MVTEVNDVLPLSLATILDEMRTNGASAKIMCFLPTARTTGLVAALFRRLNIGLQQWDIHSRKSQGARNAAADAFKIAQSGILFSSDVTYVISWSCITSEIFKSP